ncbi:uncharacterized protein LOC109836529 [Asparagus officinalis]|uniref:uncharacterized protein LOC109836529 n=1 Tax=Asparagus officinalis TaxID=4686 RepID=UPI00098E18F6|nr:uncharacterized protein LOC109836529 [Asparagus officinalis]
MDLPPNGFDLEEFQRQWELEGKILDRQQELLEELQRRSEQPHKRKSIYRDHHAAHERLMADYFVESCTYTDEQFRRRYRMKRPLFLRIVDSISNYDNYFIQRRNNAGKLGLTPIQKCMASIRMLVYGVAADACDEYVKIGESTAIECTRKFCEGVIACFGDEYLRRPNLDDLQRLLQVGHDRGFPGMIGSIDCMHWQWKNCPKAWQGQFTSGHKGTTTVILEAVASYDLWIWHAFFGLPGTLNDINVLDRSPVFDDIESGEAPRVNFTVNGRQYNLAYYLADGIYPKWPVFVQSIQMPQGNKQQFFAKQQESCRKDVERAFGVLQARFAIVRQPARMWDLDVLGKIMRACIILHNMIVEDERDTYSRNWENLDFEQSSGSSASFNVQTEVLPEFQVHVLGRSDSNIPTRAELRDRVQHIQLKKDLVEHIWQKFGTTLD